MLYTCINLKDGTKSYNLESINLHIREGVTYLRQNPHNYYMDIKTNKDIVEISVQHSISFTMEGKPSNPKKTRNPVTWIPPQFFHQLTGFEINGLKPISSAKIKKSKNAIFDSWYETASNNYSKSDFLMFIKNKKDFLLTIKTKNGSKKVNVQATDKLNKYSMCI